MQSRWDISVTVAILSLMVAVVGILLFVWVELADDILKNRERLGDLSGDLKAIRAELDAIPDRVEHSMKDVIHQIDKSLSLDTESNKGRLRDHETRIRQLEGKPSSQP